MKLCACGQEAEYECDLCGEDLCDECTRSCSDCEAIICDECRKGFQCLDCADES